MRDLERLDKYILVSRRKCTQSYYSAVACCVYNDRVAKKGASVKQTGLSQRLLLL